MTIAATEKWATCPAVNGPGFVKWLEDEGHLRAVMYRAERRLHHWRKGMNAQVHTIDRLLTPIGIGLWEIPDELWIGESNRSDFDRSPDACRMP